MNFIKNNMMSNENQMITISGFMGLAIGVLIMTLVNTGDKSRIIEQVKEIEYSVCEECWYDVFDGGWEYQFTN
jgi:hypothetical protein